MPVLVDLAAVQDRLLSIFVAGQERRVSFGSATGDTLRGALERALAQQVRLPEGVSLSFDRIHEVFPRARGVVDAWKEGAEDLIDVLSARGNEDLEAAWDDLWSREDWRRSLDSVRQLGAHQALLGVSFITTLRHYTHAGDLADAIGGAYGLYFFDEGGFRTVDGMTVRQPAFPALASFEEGALREFEQFFGEQTAERYLRDLVRITVETAADQQFELPRRVHELDTAAGLSEESRRLAKNWLAGFASMAEGLVMSSVEQLTQGVGSFRANPLVAAAASTAAGIAARKATQHAFLWQLDAGS